MANMQPWMSVFLGSSGITVAAGFMAWCLSGMPVKNPISN